MSKIYKSSAEVQDSPGKTKMQIKWRGKYMRSQVSFIVCSAFNKMNLQLIDFMVGITDK